MSLYNITTNPNNIQGLSFWLDASNLSTIGTITKISDPKIYVNSITDIISGITLLKPILVSESSDNYAEYNYDLSPNGSIYFRKYNNPEINKLALYSDSFSISSTHSLYFVCSPRPSGAIAPSSDPSDRRYDENGSYILSVIKPPFNASYSNIFANPYLPLPTGSPGVGFSTGWAYNNISVVNFNRNNSGGKRDAGSILQYVEADEKHKWNGSNINELGWPFIGTQSSFTIPVVISARMNGATSVSNFDFIAPETATIPLVEGNFGGGKAYNKYKQSKGFGATECRIVLGDFDFITYSQGNFNTISSVSASYTGMSLPDSHFCEMLVYNRYLTDEEHSKVIKYLRNKWIEPKEVNKTFRGMTGLSLWLDAADESTINFGNLNYWITSGVSFLKGIPDGVVLSISDKYSGNFFTWSSNILTTGSYSRQPLYYKQGVNNKGSIYFDGYYSNPYDGSYRSLVGTISSFPATHSIYCVSSLGATYTPNEGSHLLSILDSPFDVFPPSSSLSIIHTNTSMTSSITYTENVVKSNKDNITSRFQSIIPKTGLTQSLPNILSVRTYGDPLDSSIVKYELMTKFGSKFDKSFSAQQSWGLGATISKVVIGDYFDKPYIGTFTFSYVTNTYFCELIVFDRFLSDEDHLKVMDYLRYKWL